LGLYGLGIMTCPNSEWISESMSTFFFRYLVELLVRRIDPSPRPLPTPDNINMKIKVILCKHYTRLKCYLCFI
jgi:hypothetical protein